MKLSAKLTSLKKLFLALLMSAVLFAPVPRATAAQEPTPTTPTTPTNAGGGRLTTPEANSAEANKTEINENDEYLHSASVQKFGAMLGLNPEQAATTFTVANFLVLALLVGWFLAKSLPKTFRNRTSAIQKGLVDARAATEEANTRLSSVEERLSKLDGQIAELRAQAEKDAANEHQRILASVEEDKKKILVAAEQEIASATALARRQIQQYAAELAIDQAARKLVVSADTDRLLVQNFARRLGAEDSKEGKN
jgi:F-type H+-transporting ATPase subunit b